MTKHVKNAMNTPFFASPSRFFAPVLSYIPYKTSLWKSFIS